MKIEIAALGLLLAFSTVLAHGQTTSPGQSLSPKLEIPEQANAIPGQPNLLRFSSSIYQKNVAAADLPLKLPRFLAPVRKITWSNKAKSIPLDLSPEINFWTISVNPKQTETIEGTGTLVVEFDVPPLLESEFKPVTPTADGSIWLPAHLAKTIGDKLRYEPQPHKNTVGYWTNPNDVAQWQFAIDRPGRFNVAILQGCGAGQGGSLAKLSITPSPNPNSQPASKSEGPDDSVELDFEVYETGHFQNFHWRQLPNVVELKASAEYTLGVSAKEIRKNALMDIRAIQLIRLP